MKALLSRAAAYNALGQLDLAIEDYAKALSIDETSFRSPKSSRLHTPSTSTSDLLAEDSLVDANDRKNAFTAIHFLSKQTPISNSSDKKLMNEHFTKACRLKSKGCHLDAIQEFSFVLNMYPKHFNSLFNRGYLFHKCQYYHDAILDYSSALELESSNPYVYYNRGISYDKVHFYDLAYDDFNHALHFLPNNPDFLHNRAYCAYKLKRFDEALKDYTQVLHVSKDHRKALLHRGLCWKQMGKMDEAIKDFHRAALLKRDESCESFEL